MGLRTVFLSWVLFDTVGTYGDFVLVDTIERRGNTSSLCSIQPN
jgi:hypothetical protein